MTFGFRTESIEKEKRRREKLNADAPRLGMALNSAAGTPASNSSVSDKDIADEYNSTSVVGSDNVWKGNPDKKSFGLSVVSAPDHQPSMNATSPAQVNKSTGSFGMPNVPRLSWSERNERDNLLTKIGTPHKGSQNGQLTAKQMELMADIGGRDQKYANDQYDTQVNAASQLAETQMTQDGANSRAVLDETGNNNRFNKQLGFDTEAFRKTNAIEQQKLGFDADKFRESLAISKYNADTSRMGAETQQLGMQRRGSLTQPQINERIADYQNKTDSIDSAINIASGMIDNKEGLKGNAGLIDTYTPNIKQSSRKFKSDQKAFLSQAYLANSDLLKGVLTDRDAEELKNAFGNLQDTTVSDEDFAANLETARTLLQQTRANTDLRYQDVVPYMDQQSSQPKNGDDEERKKRTQQLGNKYFGGGN